MTAGCPILYIEKNGGWNARVWRSLDERSVPHPSLREEWGTRREMLRTSAGPTAPFRLRWTPGSGERRFIGRVRLDPWLAMAGAVDGLADFGVYVLGTVEVAPGVGRLGTVDDDEVDGAQIGQ